MGRRPARPSSDQHADDLRRTGRVPEAGSLSTPIQRDERRLPRRDAQRIVVRRSCNARRRRRRGLGHGRAKRARSRTRNGRDRETANLYPPPPNPCAGEDDARQGRQADRARPTRLRARVEARAGRSPREGRCDRVSASMAEAATPPRRRAGGLAERGQARDSDRLRLDARATPRANCLVTLQRLGARAVEAASSARSARASMRASSAESAHRAKLHSEVHAS